MFPPCAAAVTSPLRVAIGGKGDPLAVGRPRGPEEAVWPGRIALQIRLTGHIPKSSRSKIEDPDVRGPRLARGHERELRSVRRERP